MKTAPCHALFTAILIATLAPAVRAAELPLTEGFETPAITGTQSLAAGGDPTQGGASKIWESVRDRVGEGVELGLTDKVAHGGKQALYVKFTGVDKPFRGAEMMTSAIPVQGGASYALSIWGRLDESEPVSGDATAKAVVEFEGAGELERKYLSRLMGGGGEDAFTNGAEWQELTGVIEVPEGATAMRVNWVWQVLEPSGPVNGVAYFDDVSVTRQ